MATPPKDAANVQAELTALAAFADGEKPPKQAEVLAVQADANEATAVRQLQRAGPPDALQLIEAELGRPAGEVFELPATRYEL